MAKARETDPLPTRVKIGYLVYSIEELSDIEADNRRATGETAHLLRRIRVNMGMGGAAAAETLLHEILHCVWKLWDIEDTPRQESAVTKLGMGLATIWVDNPEVFAWISRRLAA